MKPDLSVPILYLCVGLQVLARSQFCGAVNISLVSVELKLTTLRIRILQNINLPRSGSGSYKNMCRIVLKKYLKK
jgi:hypothetical protein